MPDALRRRSGGRSAPRRRGEGELTTYLRVAVPSPLFQLFDYLPPAGDDGPFRPGMRIRIPFGRGKAVGVLVAVADRTDVPAGKLRQAAERLDEIPLIPEELLRLADWAAAYYHYPVGEVLATALPVTLRQGASAEVRTPEVWSVTELGAATDAATLKRAAKQAALLIKLQAHPAGLTRTQLEPDGKSALTPLRGLAEKGLVECRRETEHRGSGPLAANVQLQLNPDQSKAVTAITTQQGFAAFMLDGVTGSGKTEVYLRAIAEVLASGKQALVLVPEIALTPQLIARFEARFDTRLAVLHSGLSDGERADAWMRAQRGLASIVVGTRSAVFTPLTNPGLIIVDEEHDASFKQQEGFRYSARDLAVWRARMLDVPIVLGSATPSLETLANVEGNRYTALHLPERAGLAEHPVMHLVDVRKQPVRDGLSHALVSRMKQHLDAGNQVLLFLNRRGFAPVLQCHDCGWISACTRCDARMTLHRNDNRLRCHHCAHEAPIPARCPKCSVEAPGPVGLGTERIEQALAELFPHSPMIRIDRDATRKKGSLDRLLAAATSGEARILVGTQMLAKGHHFPGVTMVGIVDADAGLFSADFRAAERMAQLILQVAGRAGRAERPGEVFIQTHCPEHPLMNKLVSEGYGGFARAALDERKAAGLPPYAHIAIIRAEATDETAPMAFLSEVAELARGPHGAWVRFLGPVPAPMARRAGRWRAQAMLVAGTRSPLQRCLGELVPKLAGIPGARKVRWSVDVDPADTF